VRFFQKKELNYKKKNRDIWLYEKPLCLLFPDLFKFCEQQNIVVIEVRKNIHSISFRRWLMDDMLADWNKILEDVRKFNFSDNDDYTL
jgi:hypothetical protein